MARHRIKIPAGEHDPVFQRKTVRLRPQVFRLVLKVAQQQQRPAIERVELRHVVDAVGGGQQHTAGL